MKVRIEVITLYRYFAYAAHMRELLRRALDNESLKMLKDEMSVVLLLFYSPLGMYLMYSYSGIYLVIEGWKELKLKDPEIDRLIDSPLVDRLRRFRNATFHYQKDPISLKHLEFFGTEEEKTELWLNELYAEFSRFFLENTLPLPARLKHSLKGKTHVEILKAIRDYWFSEEHSIKALESDLRFPVDAGPETPEGCC